MTPDYAKGYAAALDAARDAVAALPPNGIGVAADARFSESALGQAALAAIDALRTHV